MFTLTKIKALLDKWNDKIFYDTNNEKMFYDTKTYTYLPSDPFIEIDEQLAVIYLIKKHIEGHKIKFVSGDHIINYYAFKRKYKYARFNTTSFRKGRALGFCDIYNNLECDIYNNLECDIYNNLELKEILESQVLTITDYMLWFLLKNHQPLFIEAFGYLVEEAKNLVKLCKLDSGEEVVLPIFLRDEVLNKVYMQFVPEREEFGDGKHNYYGLLDKAFYYKIVKGLSNEDFLYYKRVDDKGKEIYPDPCILLHIGNGYLWLLEVLPIYDKYFNDYLKLVDLEGGLLVNAKNLYIEQLKEEARVELLNLDDIKARLEANLKNKIDLINNNNNNKE